ncbi:MAG TPA: lysophospholipid acyltransferase family protein [Longimicrobiales bacterium]|nr:lysophospholipid acyltransferase family protein [Longimicrobiales bacterium]
MIGLLRVALVAIPATIYYAIRIVYGAYRNRPKDRPVVEDGPRKWSLLMLRAAGVRVVLENEGVIDPDRPQILVANHVSWFDVPALAGHLPGKYRFVAKQELTKVPLFGPAWQAAGHIAIDRFDRSKAIDSLAEARRKLEEDRPTVVMFAEGTRSRTGELRPFKKGAFVLGIQTGVEVVPAAILGSREVMAKGSWWVHTGRTIRIRFGTPIPVDGLEMKDRDSLTERAHRAVAELLVDGPPDSTA